MKKKKITRKDIERIVYIIIIMGLAIYGVKDSDAAVKLIQAVNQAFSLLFNFQ